MTLFDWIAETARRVGRDGLRPGLRRAGYEFYVGGLRRVGRFVSLGEEVYEREWDVLLVLDACRHDLMREVADEYGFLHSPGAYCSAGSSSEEWMTRNFAPKYRDQKRKTAYVTGNVFSRDYATANEFKQLDEVWRYAWDSKAGTIHPEPITDRAIVTHRDSSPDRMIVHYMQPHHPFVGQPLQDRGINKQNFGREQDVTTVWDRLRDGELSYDEVWCAYKDNLRYVLDSVAVLLSSINAETVVITSDHGNLMGEYGIYGHPTQMPIPLLRRVPWYTTSAEDSGEYEPVRRDYSPACTELPSAKVQQQLRDLGYK